MASLSLDSNTEVLQPYFHLRDAYHQVTMQYKEPNFCVLNKIRSMVNKYDRKTYAKETEYAEPKPYIGTNLLLIGTKTV